MSTILKRTIIIFPRSSAVYTNIFTIIGEGKKRADTYLKVGIQHRMTPSDEQKTERRRRADGKKRKKERKKKVHPWPSTDFNFVVRKERTSRIVSTLPVNNVPSECGRRGRRRRRAKSHGPFFPRLYIPRPESLSVSLVLPLFIARARGCHTALHNTDKSRCVRNLLSQQCIDWLRGCSRKIVVKNRG